MLFYLIKAPDNFEPKLSKEHILHKWVGKEDLKNLDKEVQLEKHTREILQKVLA